MSDPLAPLMRRAQKGDRTALEELCAEMRPRLFYTALSITRDRALADDIAQRTLLRALEKRFLFLQRGTVAGWMSTIAVNLAKNHFRDTSTRRGLLDAEAKEPAAEHDTPEALLIERALRDRLWDAIDTLSAVQQDIVRLRLTAELSFNEIAISLGMRTPNVRQHFAQAKKKLMKNIENENAKNGISS